jgi:hypothetical protein
MRWLPVCLALSAAVLPTRGAAQNATDSGVPETKATSKTNPAAKPIPLEKLKVPPGGILVLVEQAKSALQLFPKMVLLTPQKFQELMDRISALERQVKADKKLPSICRLTGRLDGDVVRLQAEYRFTTERPGVSVFLGGQGAVITEATWGEHGTKTRGGNPEVPFLEPGDNGYSVQVDRPGEYVLNLRFQLPVQVRASPLIGNIPERGFELGLPGAAVTLLTLTLPPAVKELRWNEFTEKASQRIDAGHASPPGQWMVPVGRVKNLNVSWKEPINIPGAEALRTADGQIVVQIQEGHVLTIADLALADLRGRTREWRLWAPSSAQLEVKPPPGLTGEILAPAGPGAPHVVRLSEPTTEKFNVRVQLRTDRPSPRLPVGHFSVLDAYRQQGTITVKANPEALRGLKPVYHRQGEVVERDIPKEAAAADAIAVFKYWNMLPPGMPVTAAPLEIEFQRVKGAVETHVEHTLQLKQVQKGWQVLAVSRIHAKPVHDGVDYLEVQLPRARPEGLGVTAVAPADFPVCFPWAAIHLATQPHWPVRVPQDYDLEGEDGAAAAEMDLTPESGKTGGRRVGIKLHRFLSKKFTVVLTGTYLLPRGITATRLELPRPVGVLDRGAKILVEVEENLELMANENTTDTLSPALSSQEVADGRLARRHQQTTVWQRTPAYAVLAWKPYRADVAQRTLADVTVRPQYAHVRQELSLEAGEMNDVAAKHRGLGQVALHVPRMVRGLSIGGGGKLQLYDADKQTAWIVASTEGAAVDQFVATYDFPLPPEKPPEASRRAPRELAVPLLWVETATRAETRVRFWCDPGNVPTLVQPDAIAGPWRDLGTEIVQGRDSLPALVVAGEGMRAPLQVRVDEALATPLQPVVLERGLVQVAVDEEGTEYYRARFLVSKLHAHHLDIELPAPPAGLVLQIGLDHKRIPWQLAPEERGTKSDERAEEPSLLASGSSPLVPRGNQVRCMVHPSLYGRPVVLDITYRLVAGRPLGSWPWRNSLLPPRIDDAVLRGRVRWQVSLPAKLVGMVASTDAYVEQQWAWRGGFPQPEAATTAAELEQWFGGGGPGSSLLASDSSLSIVCWRTSMTPLTLIRVPRQVWFLLCSGLVVSAGLALSFMRWPRLALGLLAVLLGAAIAAGAICWPSGVPFLIYGCVPGVLVLLLLIGVQWMIHRQYRRQLVFMPGFTRMKSGSSLVRTGGGRPREPSTVDAIPAAEDQSSPTSE